MAIRYAVATGLWSATSTWDGTTTIPTTGDTVVANTFTVTIDVNTAAVTQIQTSAAGGGAAGGGFVLNNGITLTGNLVCGTSGTTVITFSAAAGTIVGNVGNGSNNTTVATNTGTGTLTITGNVVGGGVAVSQHGLTNTSSGTVTITGNVTAGANANGVKNQSSGIINVTGTVTGSSGTASAGISNDSTGTVNITGNVVGGSASNGHGISNASTGVVNVTGNVTATTTACGINSTTAGYIAVVGTITASTLNGIASSSTTAYNNLTGPFVDSSIGVRAAYCNVFALSPSSTISTTNWKFAQAGAVVPNYNGYRFMYTAGVSIGNPTAADVRSGTAFGANNELTGTCAIPSASYVSLGVSIDNTVGSLSSNSPGLLQNTTIATLASQTSFTLTSGSTDDGAYNGQIIIISNQSNAVQKAIGRISNYVGSSKTVTLLSNPGIFTMATGNLVNIIARSSY